MVLSHKAELRLGTTICQPRVQNVVAQTDSRHAGETCYIVLLSLHVLVITHQVQLAPLVMGDLQSPEELRGSYGPGETG